MRLVIVGVALALLMVACGGAAGSSVTATPGATATATTPPAPTATLTNTPTPSSTPSPTPEPACSTKDGAKVYDQFEDIAQRWDDAIALADQTPRMQLSDRIADLQTIRRDLRDQDWPDCADAAQAAFIDMMQAGIDGYTAFLGSEDDSVVQSLFDDYRTKQDAFIAELGKLR